jgi:hypothetical protein
MGGQELLGVDDFSYFVLIVTDMYGTTMFGSQELSTDVIQQHEMYLDLLPRLDVDAYKTLTPIPYAVIIDMAAINIRRAALAGHVDLQSTAVCGIEASVAGFVAYLKAFGPVAWAEQAIHNQSSQLFDVQTQQQSLLEVCSSITLGSWAMLALAF